MATLKILFLGIADDRLLRALKRRGYQLEVDGAHRAEIWEAQRLIESQDTGFYMSTCMRELIEDARSKSYDYVIVRLSVSFAAEILPDVPYAVRSKLLLDFRRQLALGEYETFASLGCQHFTSNRHGESPLDWLLAQEGAKT